jgi:hypothetical protein
VRFHDLRKWKSPVDTRHKVARGKVVENVLFDLREGRRIADDFEESVSLDGQLLAENGE